MSELELTRLLRSLDRPAATPPHLSEQIWAAVESALIGSPGLSKRPDQPIRARWNGPLAATAAAAVVLAAGFATWALLGPQDQPPVASTTTTLPASTSLPQAPPEAVVGTPDDGFADVIAALDEAEARWQPGEDYRYAYRLTVLCDCPEDGSRWVRFFDQTGDDDLWHIPSLFDRIRTDIEAAPGRIELAFSPDDGHPTYYSVTWEEGSAKDDLVAGMADFHEITLTDSVVDGVWRFTSGVVDGQDFGNPALYGAIYLTLDSGFASFPVDCNTGGGMVDIYEDAFGVGQLATTDAGCMEYSSEAQLFVAGIGRAERILHDGSELVITGPEVELRFVTPAGPESLGELPLTAAGETLLLDFPDGRSRGVVYTIADRSRELGDFVMYVLTAEADGVDSVAGWDEWGGEFEVPDVVVTGPGPDRIVIPDTVLVGDYRLCSPYWEPDPFCFDLTVRPASAPWFVTAGSAGVVLHDADGTSSLLSDQPASIAFLVEGLPVSWAGEGDPMVLNREGQVSEVPLQQGEVLLDVAVINGRLVALVSNSSSSTSAIDLDSGERTEIGQASTEGRLHDGVAMLRVSEQRLEARSMQADLLWEAAIDAETMIVPTDPGVVRLDRFGELNVDYGFRQYLSTRLIDVSTGHELDAFEYELAIPLEGDEITDRCLRAELRDGLMLCPQPDGRLVTLGVEGGDMRNFPAGQGGLATYVRGEG